MWLDFYTPEGLRAKDTHVVRISKGQAIGAADKKCDQIDKKMRVQSGWKMARGRSRKKALYETLRLKFHHASETLLFEHGTKVTLGLTYSPSILSRVAVFFFPSNILFFSKKAYAAG